MTSTVLTRNNVSSAGVGRPMLFSHGYGCDQQVWRHIVPAFADHRVILFDHVGAGKSDLAAFSPFKYHTLHGYADDILEICEALTLTEVVLVGHSVSAVIGALAVVKRPELFHSLIMVAPSPCYTNFDDYVGGFTAEDLQGLLDLLDSNHMGWSAMMAPVIMGNPERPELGQDLAGHFCRTDSTIARHFARATFLSNHVEDLTNVRIPSLTLQCSDDAIAPTSVGAYMNRKMQGNKLVLMAAKGHCPHLSAPEETVQALRSFVDHHG